MGARVDAGQRDYYTEQCARELVQTFLVWCTQNARRVLLKAIQLASELGLEPCFLTPPIASGSQRAT